MVRTTVVGSYPRIGDIPEEQTLRRTIGRFDRGEASDSDVAAAERETVRAVLGEQNAAGLDVVTDGLVTWNDSASHLCRRLAGIEIGGLVRYFDTNTYYRQPIVTGDVAWNGPILVDEWTYAQGASRAPVRAVLTGPATLAHLALDRHYGKKRSLVRAFAEALASEVDALQAKGAKHIQIDEPILTTRPEDLSLVSQGLDAIVARKGAAELVLAAYFGDVAKIYRELQGLPVDVLLLDLVQGSKTWPSVVKHGSEKPLVLGLVDARNTRLEDPKAIAAQVLQLRDSVDLKASSVSPSNGLEYLPRDRARQKLAILVDAAKRVGGEA